MFHSSSHKKYWIFPSLEEINKLRQKCIENFAFKYSVPGNNLPTLEEQKILCKYHEQKLFRLCFNFQPPLPYSVIFTSFVYFKRIYLQTSIMENLPQDVISVCLYLACKVEEYNVSVDKFVLIYPEADRFNIADTILSNEMNLMRLLNYHLIVHSPKRAMEGLLIDIKTRFPQGEDPDLYREKAVEFLNSILFTDVAFLYPPSQIALAALLTASKAVIQKYILSVLAPGEQGKTLLEKVHNIIKLVNTDVVCENDHVKVIQEKLNRNRFHEKGKVKKRKTASTGGEESSKRQKASNFHQDE